MQFTSIASPEQFDSFVDAMLPELVGHACKWTHSRSEAEDLAQDAVLRAWQARTQFSEGTNARAWMHRILSNTFISSYRRRRREAEIIASVDFQSESDDPTPITAADDVGDEVERALSALPEDFRAVLLSVDVDELSYREVAMALNMPIGTVMSRLHRARRAMKTRLRDYARSEGYLAQAA